MSDTLSTVDSIAGLAALVNGLILWPIVRSLQSSVKELQAERKTTARRRRK